MSDDLMEQRLRSAGERWRAANAEPASAAVRPVTAPLLVRGPRRSRRRWAAAVSGFVIAAVVVVGVVLVRHEASPGTRPASAGAALLGRWTIVTAHGPKGQGIAPSSGASFTLARSAATGRWSIDGSDGVNSFQGSVTVRSDRIEVADLAISAVGTTAPNAATAIDAVLSAPATWSVAGNQLTLANSAGTIVARAQPVAPRSPTLTGTSWQLMTIEVGPAASPPTSTAYLVLDPDGAIRWSDGCNELTGTATTVGQTLTIRPDGQPNVGCGGNAVYGQSATLAGVLTGRVSWSINADRLTLTKGRTHLVYGADIDPGFTGVSPAPTPASATSSH